MPKFIQLPQEGSALPYILNTKDIHHTDFFNGPERGGREILLRIWINTPKALDLKCVRFTSVAEGLAMYARLQSLLNPADLTQPILN